MNQCQNDTHFLFFDIKYLDKKKFCTKTNFFK